jgi:hypothetical protein
MFPSALKRGAPLPAALSLLIAMLYLWLAIVLMKAWSLAAVLVQSIENIQAGAKLYRGLIAITVALFCGAFAVIAKDFVYTPGVAVKINRLAMGLLCLVLIIIAWKYSSVIHLSVMREVLIK